MKATDQVVHDYFAFTRLDHRRTYRVEFFKIFDSEDFVRTFSAKYVVVEPIAPLRAFWDPGDDSADEASSEEDDEETDTEDKDTTEDEDVEELGDPSVNFRRTMFGQIGCMVLFVWENTFL